jgi:hypothetical protein
MRRPVALLVLVLALGACTINQRGPWVDGNGRRLLGSEVIEFDGFSDCGQKGVIFLRFFGDQYARDPDGVLGTLYAPTDGRVITFEVLDALPDGVEGTDITHAGREIYVGDDRADHLYVRLPDGDVEQWPRAEVPCESDE